VSVFLHWIQDAALVDVLQGEHVAQHNLRKDVVRMHNLGRDFVAPCEQVFYLGPDLVVRLDQLWTQEVDVASSLVEGPVQPTWVT